MDYKKKFINYCKGKIKDLGAVEYDSPSFEDEVEVAKVLMTADWLRGVKNARILDPGEDECLKVLNKKGEIVYDTPMLSPVTYAARLEFNAIDPDFYADILDWWDDICMDELMEEEA